MSKRIQREKKTIEAMLRIYCQAKHADNLCEDCQQLLAYADKRLDNCPFHENKPACNNCSVHCYSAKRKEEVRTVMRYAGPRMIYKHPFLALGHMLDLLRKAPFDVK